MIFVDTPGLHSRRGKLINQAMNRTAGASASGADLLLLVIEATGWRAADDFALARVRDASVPAVLVVNKIDLVKPRSALLPLLEDVAERHEFVAVVPVSARREENLDRLLACIRENLPESPPLFPTDMRTDRGLEFRVAEILREKLLMQLDEEVPYGLAVEVRALEEQDDLVMIDVLIWVDRDSHRGIVVGKGGQRLKKIGSAARRDIEQLLGKQVHLQTRVKVKENWGDSAMALRQLGYEEPG
jgi:GTP-binding protein Era